MLNKDDNAYGSKIQKKLNQLISEEWYAGQTYLLYIQSMKRTEDVHKLHDLFEEIANDELNDHLVSLCKYARHCGYDIPCGIKDFEKHADLEVSKLFNNMKKGKDAAGIIDEAIQLKTLAIKAYDEAKNSDEVQADQDLLRTIVDIFYDECEHIQNLQFLKYAFNASQSIM